MRLIYYLAVQLRYFLYKANFIKRIEFDLPVIAVGNLSTGGTGKTPMVEYLIGLLSDKFEIAVLSRGYRRRSKGFIIADDTTDARSIGDEPMQFHHKYPEVTVCVGEERALAIPEILSENADIQAVIMDDAFQHLPVKAGLYILLTQYDHLFLDDELLPSGRLREPKKSANKADIVVVTKCPADISNAEQQKISTRIRKFSHAPVFFSSLEYLPMYDLFDPDRELILDKEQKIVLLTAIAKSNFVEEYVATQGNLVKHFNFADHHYFTTKELEEINQFFEKNDIKEKIVITTEKDAMRLLLHKEWLTKEGLGIFVLPVKMKFINTAEEFNNLTINFISEFKSKRK